MANRNLLIDVGENVRFDSTTLPANCSITNAGKTLTRTSGTAVQSACCAGFARRRGKLWAGVQVGGGIFGFGIGTTFASLALNIGGSATDANTWAVYFGSAGANTWEIWHAGVNSGSLGTCVAGDLFWLVVDIQDGNLWLGHATSASPGAITWAGGGDPFAGTTPTYSNLNSGGTIAANVQRAYRLMGSPYNAGDTGTLITNVDHQLANATWLLSGMTPWGEWGYYSSTAINTAPNDTQWQRIYDGRITPGGDPEYTRSVSPWTFTGTASQPQIPITNVDLINSDGSLDWMTKSDARDIRITGWLYNLASNTTSNTAPDSSTWTKAFSLIVDHAESPDEETIRFVTSDSLARLATPVQVNFYPATVPNAQIAGQPKPFMLGLNQFVPLVPYDIANLEFDLCDSPPGPITNLYDQGVVISQGTGWQFSRSAGANGVTRVTNPAGKQCVVVNGQMVLDKTTPSGIAEPWGAWASGAPGGMVVTVGANCTLTNPSGTLAQFNCTANQANHTSTLQCAYIPPSQSVWVEIVCSAFTSGYVEVVALPTSNVVDTTATHVLCKIDRVGTYRFQLTGNNANRGFAIQWGKVICNLQISGAVLYKASTTDTLAAWVNEICINRIGMAASEVDTAGTIATLSALGYTLSYYQQQNQINALDLLQLALDSFTGGMWQDRLGTLKMGRLQDPSGLTSVMRIDDSVVVGNIIVSDDFATGLTARLYGLKNNAVHGDADLAGSVINTTTATMLKTPWGTTATGVGNLDSFYDDANRRDPRPTALSVASYVQTEATRVVGTLYNLRRRFWAFDVICTDAASYTLEPFQCIQLIIGNGTNIFIAGNGRVRYYLGGSGKNLVIVSAKSRFLSDRVSLLCWG